MRILLGLLLVSTATAQADSGSANILAPTNPLPIETMDTIRQISQNVLQAKKSGKQQLNNDNSQLSSLNAALTQLINVQVQILQPGAIYQAGKAPAKNTLLARIAAQSQAYDVIAGLREQSSQLQAQGNKPAQVQVYSGGLAVGEQRGRLFDKWADELETILADNGNILPQLKNFQARINNQTPAVLQTSGKPETPSLQAMPWNSNVNSNLNNSH